MKVDDEQNEITVNPDTGSSFSFGFSKTVSENNRVIVTFFGTASSDSVTVIQTDTGITVTGLNDMTITYSENDEVVAETTVNVTDGREVNVTVDEATDTIRTAFVDQTDTPDQPATPVTPDPEPQPVGCPWCGQEHVGFFAGLIAWFHGILARIFGARY